MRCNTQHTVHRHKPVSDEAGRTRKPLVATSSTPNEMPLRVRIYSACNESQLSILFLN